MTYDNEDYHEIAENYLYEIYDEMLDGTYTWPKVGYCEVSPSEFLKEHDPIAYRVGFNDYVDSMMQDGELYEDENEFIDQLLDDWLHGDGWLDAWLDVDPTDLLHAAQHMHDTGRLELVDGGLQPHPLHTISTIQALITEELA